MDNKEKEEEMIAREETFLAEAREDPPSLADDGPVIVDLTKEPEEEDG